MRFVLKLKKIDLKFLYIMKSIITKNTDNKHEHYNQGKEH